MSQDPNQDLPLPPVKKLDHRDLLRQWSKRRIPFGVRADLEDDEFGNAEQPPVRVKAVWIEGHGIAVSVNGIIITAAQYDEVFAEAKERHPERTPIQTVDLSRWEIPEIPVPVLQEVKILNPLPNGQLYIFDELLWTDVFLYKCRFQISSLTGYKIIPSFLEKWLERVEQDPVFLWAYYRSFARAFRDSYERLFIERVSVRGDDVYHRGFVIGGLIYPEDFVTNETQASEDVIVPTPNWDHLDEAFIASSPALIQLDVPTSEGNYVQTQNWSDHITHALYYCSREKRFPHGICTDFNHNIWLKREGSEMKLRGRKTPSRNTSKAEKTAKKNTKAPEKAVQDQDSTALNDSGSEKNTDESMSKPVYREWHTKDPNDGIGKDIEVSGRGARAPDLFDEWSLYNVKTVPMVVDDQWVNFPPKNVRLSDEMVGYLFGLFAQGAVDGKQLGKRWPADFTREGYPVHARVAKGNAFKVPDAKGIMRYGVAQFMILSGNERPKFDKKNIVLEVNRPSHPRPPRLWIHPTLAADESTPFTGLDLKRCSYLDHTTIDDTWKPQIPPNTPKKAELPKDSVVATPITKSEVIVKDPSFFKPASKDGKEDQSGTANTGDSRDASAKISTPVQQSSQYPPPPLRRQDPPPPAISPSGSDPPQHQSDPSSLPLPGQNAEKVQNEANPPPVSNHPPHRYGNRPSQPGPPSIDDLGSAFSSRKRGPPSSTPQEQPKRPHRAIEYPINWMGYELDDEYVADEVVPVTQEEVELIRGCEANPSPTEQALLHVLATMRTINASQAQRIDDLTETNEKGWNLFTEELAEQSGQIRQLEARNRALTMGARLFANTSADEKSLNRLAQGQFHQMSRITPKNPVIANPDLEGILKRVSKNYVEGSAQTGKEEAIGEINDQQYGFQDYLQDGFPKQPAFQQIVDKVGTKKGTRKTFAP